MSPRASRDMLNRERVQLVKRLGEVDSEMGEIDERDGRSLKLNALNFEKDTDNKCINVTINMTPEVSQSGRLSITIDELVKFHRFVEASWIWFVRRPQELAEKAKKEAAKNQK